MEIKTKSHPWFIPHQWSRWTVEGDYQEKRCLKCGRVKREIIRDGSCVHYWNIHSRSGIEKTNLHGKKYVDKEEETWKCNKCGQLKLIIRSTGKETRSELI